MSEMSISEAAAAAGCTPTELRAWGHRYRWPRPRRNVRGGRVFSSDLVDLLRKVVAERDRGTPIGQILAHGMPTFPRRAEDPPPPRLFIAVNLDGLPEPIRTDGVQLRRALLDNLGRGSSAPALRAQAVAGLPRCHPTDRPAIMALVERIEQTEGTA